jgi:EAL domain-containing protein (putative c-di-GMP-specific phosphodiesterase class I)
MAPDATVHDEFQRVLENGLLRTQFQPIVTPDSRAVAGYEGLVRGPVGSTMESADALIDEAYREGRVVEFDWVARATASRAALAAGLGTDELLFLNIEPLALASTCPPELWPVVEEAFHKFHVVLEVTERSLDHDPKTLLEGIDRQRPTVSGLALDDVGADVRTLSMLPTLEPDVIKLDLKVTHGSPSRRAMKVLDYVYEEAERTGAIILAEGVETERHHKVVCELGAPLAQGWLYGRPTDHPVPGEYPLHMRLGLDVALEEVRTPFEVLGGRTISHASAEVIHALSHEIFTSGVHLLEPALTIVLVPSPEFFNRTVRQVLAQSARRGVVAGALGPGLPGEPAPGVRGSWEHDPSLDGEWARIALSPSTAVAVLARQLPGTGSLFDFGITHDRQRVISAARCLLRRLGPRVDAA